VNLIKTIIPSNLPASVQGKDTLTIQREIVLQTIYNVLLIIASLGFIYVFVGMPDVFQTGKFYIYLIGILVLVGLTFIRQIHYNIRAIVLILALVGVSYQAFMVYGLSGTGVIFLFASILLGFILFNIQIAVLLSIVSFGMFAYIGSGMSGGSIPVPPVEVLATSGNANQWVTAGLVLLFGIGVTASSIVLIIQRTGQALKERELLSEALIKEQESLEQRVEERSLELKQKVAQFEIASQIAREISVETDLDALLNNTVNSVSEQFGYYHVGVYLNDDQNEYTVLRAATGSAGQSMLERDHRLKIGEIGLVGFAASRGEARVSSNASEDPLHYKNPFLPETQSELALPLRAGNKVIGVLDVQSVVKNAFLQGDIQILQMIADQLAIAFEKVRLVNELQRSVEELEAANRAVTQKSWQAHLKNLRRRPAYRYREAQLEDHVEETDHAREALEQGQTVIKTIQKEDENGKPFTVLAVPIKLRNQVLGVVDIHFNSPSVTPDMISLIQNTVDRLAVSLENARLLEEIQMRAERERLVSEISSKVRSASDVDSVLRIAIQEIGQSLGVSEVMVQLRKDA